MWNCDIYKNVSQFSEAAITAERDLLELSVFFIMSMCLPSPRQSHLIWEFHFAGYFNMSLTWRNWTDNVDSTQNVSRRKILNFSQMKCSYFSGPIIDYRHALLLASFSLLRFPSTKGFPWCFNVVLIAKTFKFRVFMQHNPFYTACAMQACCTNLFCLWDEMAVQVVTVPNWRLRKRMSWWVRTEGQGYNILFAR